MKPGKTRGVSEAHRYTLWRDAVIREDGKTVYDAVVITMGDHGALLVTPETVDGEKLPGPEAGESLKTISLHNTAEMNRAMEEERKWELRMKESPLGKTQQDFVAYYAGLISLFKEWHDTHGPPPLR
jgi:hypothetical protein